MTAILLLMAAALCAYGGFACFALAMPEHSKRAGLSLGDSAASRRRLRISGALMLVLAYAACFWRDGPGFGSLLWGVLIFPAAIGVAFTLTWWPWPRANFHS